MRMHIVKEVNKYDKKDSYAIKIKFLGLEKFF